MVSLKTLGIVGGVGLAGLAGYFFLWPNTGLVWLGMIGARSKEEIEGYFHGVRRGIMRLGGGKDDFEAYIDKEWVPYWKSQSPMAAGTIDYWANWAKKLWA